VSKGVSPTQRLRAEADELFASGGDLASILEDVARVSVRLLLQTALEAEVDAFLGRARDQRRDSDGPAGGRNGWPPPTTVPTTMGDVERQRPRLRGTDEAFCSRLVGAGVTRTNAWASLVIAGWVRGLSDRDVAATLAEVLGPEAALSRSTVRRSCQRIREEFAAWRSRDLSSIRLDDLFLDASHGKLDPARPPSRCWPPGHRDRRQARLGRAGTGSVGVDRRLGRRPGRPDRPRAARPAAGDQRRRGRAHRRVRRAFPASLRQRCLVHRARNVLAKVSPTITTRSAPTTGRASTSATPSPATRPSRSHARRPKRSRPSGARATRRRSPASPATSPRSPSICASLPSTGTDPALQPDRADLRGDPPADQGHRPAPRRGLLPEPGLGRPGPRQRWLARADHDPQGAAPAAGSPPSAPAPTRRRGAIDEPVTTAA
jgi:hypothetical protein